MFRKAKTYHGLGEGVSVGVEVLQHVLESVPLLVTQSVPGFGSALSAISISVSVSIAATFIPIIASSAAAVIAITVAVRFARFSPKRGPDSLQRHEKHKIISPVVTHELLN